MRGGPGLREGRGTICPFSETGCVLHQGRIKGDPPSPKIPSFLSSQENARAGGALRTKEHNSRIGRALRLADVLGQVWSLSPPVQRRHLLCTESSEAVKC